MSWQRVQITLTVHKMRWIGTGDIAGASDTDVVDGMDMVMPCDPVQTTTHSVVSCLNPRDILLYKLICTLFNPSPGHWNGRFWAPIGCEYDDVKPHEARKCIGNRTLAFLGIVRS